MKHTVPQVTTILKFLESKGWQVAEKSKSTIYLSPPAYFVFEKPFTFEISASEMQEGYRRHVMFTVSSIAEMYDFTYQLLYDLLCYNYIEVKEILEQYQPQHATS